jgi:hypothetical protein
MPARRTPEQVRSDIGAERERLTSAVAELRRTLGDAADLAAKVKARLPLVAGAASAAGLGLGATIRLITRRGREPHERFRIGRFAVVDRDHDGSRRATRRRIARRAR